ARRQGLAGGVEEAHPERGRHAGAAVGGGAVADAKDEPGGPGVEGGTDQLAGAVGGGPEGLADVAWQAGQAGGFGHLHERVPAPDRDGGLDRLAGRTGGGGGDALATGGGDPGQGGWRAVPPR